MSNYTLKNNFLQACFKAQGAELISLKKNNIEYIWQGDPAFWNRHAPVLFPFVGSLKNGSYTYQNQTYSLGQHGFARDKSFIVSEQTENSITFELKEDGDTLKVYPFNFIFQIKYTLTSYGVTTSYFVENSDKEDLYFSVGGHPAFNCPFEPNQTREEYILMFDNDSTPEAKLIEGSLIGNESYKVFNQAGILELPKNVFDNDAIVFNPNPFSQVDFIHEPTGNTYMSVEFKNFPYLGIWSKNQEAPFICIEPWYGIADNVNHNQEITEKEGIIKLSPRETFHCEYQIIININHE
ncbi:aldose 1-epimerase family protein [Wenyingzhuangia sp. IMCC45467]